MAIALGSAGQIVKLGSQDVVIHLGDTQIYPPAGESVSWTGNLRKRVRLVGGQNRHDFGNSNSDGSVDTSVFSGFLLPSGWVENGGSAYIRRFLALGTSGSSPLGQTFFRLSSTDSGDGGEIGPNLVESLESTLQITVSTGGNSISLVMSGDDTTEPYTFTPSNGADFASFIDALTAGLHDTTITLTNPN